MGDETDNTVIQFDLARARILAKANNDAPEWSNDIRSCCLYAQMIKAEHHAERARIEFESHQRGVVHWWSGPPDLKQRVHANNHTWDIYRALIAHIARLPASKLAEAKMKRNTIGKLWLRCEGEWYERLREGCVSDDHLFPSSLRLKGSARR